MTQRAKRRQRWRKYAASQKQAVSGQNCPTGGIRFPNSGVEMLERLKAGMLAFSGVEVPPWFPRGSMYDRRIRFEMDVCRENQEAVLRASAATMQIFQIPLTEATKLVRRFCSEHPINSEQLYRHLTDGSIALHPDRYLVRLPREQNWVLYPTLLPSQPQSYIDLGNGSVEILVLNWSVEFNHLTQRPATIIEFQSPHFFQVFGERVWIDGAPILGRVLGCQAESRADGLITSTVRMQIPVVAEEREAQDLRTAENGARVLRCSEFEYSRMVYPRRLVDTGHLRRTPTRPKPCNDCRNYHGQTYGGNFLVCGMHPYGVETEQCVDWEKSDRLTD